MRFLFRAFLFICLTFPFLILSTKFNLALGFSLEELIWTLKNTFYQSTISALVGFSGGLLLASGLLYIESMGLHKIRNSLNWILLIPNIIPSLFIILFCLNSIDPFPMGLMGISIIHAVMYSGLIGVTLAKVFEAKLGALSELALIEGTGTLRFYFLGAFPILKSDIFHLLSYIFILSFMSFSVPLIVGGGRGTTLEVLIYEKVRLSNEWGQAISLSLFQTILLGLFGWIPTNKSFNIRGRSQYNLKILSSFLGVIFLFFYIWIWAGSYLVSLPEAFLSLKNIFDWEVFQQALINSTVIGTLTGILIFMILSGVVYFYPDRAIEKIILFFMTPSAVLYGFSCLFFGPNIGWISIFKLVFCCTFMSLISLYRAGLKQNLSELDKQLEITSTMTENLNLRFQWILGPQALKTVGFLSGLGAVWSLGDFALSKILFTQEHTLALEVETLMSTYRLNAAMGMSFILLILSLILFYFFWSLGDVISRKFIS